ncbi:MFS transporter [Roseiconus nitratireducens]|uniref:MFS transporter n=2 Tax=Roseiconus nitratireducens TaxID=2605748 RepID=A0A5M6DJX8_9BACT|nr:MFS transporter [Roseiconus nitratireducens]
MRNPTEDDDVLRGPSVSPSRSLLAALVGFFIITLDALVVSVALPAIGDTLDGDLVGLQWIMDGYTLPFAALLLLGGTLSDRIGARTAFGIGLVVFTISSAACGWAGTLGMLVSARFVQGAGAALMTPASLALIGEAYPDPVKKSRAIGLWAVGGAVASAAGPLVGGALTTISWRFIFWINLPVGVFALWLLSAVPKSQRMANSFDWSGQIAALLALTSLTFGLIEAGELGVASPQVIVCLAVACASTVAFLLIQAYAINPMIPLGMFRSSAAAIPVVIGFTFMAGFYGMVFLVSLFLQQQRGLTPFETGITFVPVTAFSIVMPIVAARVAERFGNRVPIVAGQAAMASGLFALGMFADTASVAMLIAMMVPVGFGAGMAMPSATSTLLNSVPSDRSGTASGVLNTSRQVGGAIAVAAFGALVAAMGYQDGVRASFAIAGGLLTLTMFASMRLR